MASVASRMARVAAHYDELSAYYARLWGEHIHHGYYPRGDESRAEATLNLVELLLAGVAPAPAARVLDVGCGVGGTARYLASARGCRVAGVTLSSTQARMATQMTTVEAGSPAPRFVVGDAAALPFSATFDAVLAIEVLSHVVDRRAFFEEAARLLLPGGRIGIAAWLRCGELGDEEERELIVPIEEGMLVTLPTREEYEGHLVATGLDLVSYRDVSTEVARTWDLCLEIVADPALWALALTKGSDTIAFVRSFRAMQRGFGSGAFRYALIVAEKS